MKKILPFIFLLFLAIGLSGCNKGHTEESVSKENSSSAPPARSTGAVPVVVATATRQNVEERVGGSGTFYSRKQVHLSPNVGGKLIEIEGDVGDRVASGSVLFRVDELQYRLNLERVEAALKEVKSREVQAKAALRQAELDLDYKKLELERNRNLIKTETISQAAFDRVKNAYEMAMANVDAAKAQIGVVRSTLQRTEKEVAIARQNLKDTSVLAPFSGVITQKKANVGEICQPGMVVIAMEQTDAMELWIDVSSGYLGKIGIGTRIYYQPEGWDSWQQTAVDRIDPKVDMASRTIRLIVLIKNSDGRLLPGLFAKADIVVNTFPQAVVIPSIAIVNGQKEKTVFVAEQGRAVARTVTTGFEKDNQIIVLSGIKDGESIIVSGQSSLKGGEAIAVKQGEMR